MLEKHLDEILINKNIKNVFIGDNLKDVDIVTKNIIRNNLLYTLSNYDKVTILSLALTLFDDEDITVIDNELASMLMFDFLVKEEAHNNMILDLIPTQSLSYKTAKMVYETINKIRSGKKTKNTKLDNLINKFISYLKDIKVADDLLVIETAIKYIANNDENVVIAKLGFGNNVEFLLLDNLNDKLTYIETEFLMKLFKVYSQNDFIYFKQAETNNVINKKVCCYGFSNEVLYIINEIEQQKLPFNDVAIYCSDASYNNLLESYLENKKIPFSFVSGKIGLTDDFLSFCNETLEFLINHFSISALSKIYSNPVINGIIDEAGNELIFENKCQLPKLKADKALLENALKKESWTYSQKVFLSDLLDLHNENLSLNDFYKKFIEFVLTYSNQKSQEGIKENLLQKQKFFSYINFDMNFDEKLLFIREVISGINVSSNDVEDPHVNIENMKSSHYLYRKYNFFIGMSALQMEQKTYSSPLFSDEEFEESLSNEYFIDFCKDKNEALENSINHLFNSLSNVYLYLSYSGYDSLEFKELAPSKYVLNADIKFNDFINSSILIEDINNFETKIFSNETIDLLNEGLKNLTASKLGNLFVGSYHCPLSYLYSLIHEDMEYDEYEGMWLDALSGGTFTHLVLQKYFTLHPIGTSINKEDYEKCFNEAKNKMVEDIPFDSQEIVDSESSKIYSRCLRYLTQYYKNESNHKYRTLKCEYGFYDLEVKFDNKTYTFKGSIDRIDGYIDEMGKPHIRIIDYKTSRPKEYENIIKNNEATQAYIYSLAVKKDIENIKKLLRIPSYNGEIIFEPFQYHLFRDLKGKYSVNEETIEETRKNIDLAIHKLNLLLNEPTYENFLAIYSPISDKLKGDSRNSCKDCKNARFCAFRIANGEYRLWKRD